MALITLMGVWGGGGGGVRVQQIKDYVQLVLYEKLCCSP